MSKHAPTPRAATGGLAGEYPGPRVVAEDASLVIAGQIFAPRTAFGQGAPGADGADGTSSGAFTNSSVAPVGPTEGDRWWNPTVGVEFTYINDGTSSQWVEV